MVLRYLVQTWLSNAAKNKLRDAALHSVRDQLAQAAEVQPVAGPQPCHVGLVFALGIESGCTEDAMEGMVTINGEGFVAREGALRGRRTVLIRSGPGRPNAARATEVLIDGHKPDIVISAGFAGALCPELKRNDILIADQLVDCNDSEMPVELPAGLLAATSQPGMHRGSLLTNDGVVRLPSDRQRLFQRWGAMAVEMETFAVAQVCRQRQTPFASIRVINDTSDEILPNDVEHLLSQKSGAAQLGAALGSIWRRPASAKDMYQLRENALVASLRLAKFLTALDVG